MTPLHQEIFQTLTRFDQAPMLQILARLLKDADWQTRKYAAFALGQMANPQAVELLIGALEDEKDEVVDFVVRGLAKRENSRAVEPLKELLELECYDFTRPLVWAL